MFILIWDFKIKIFCKYSHKSVLLNVYLNSLGIKLKFIGKIFFEPFNSDFFIIPPIKFKFKNN